MRTRKEIEDELEKIKMVNPAEATRISILERSLGETLHLMTLVEELLRLAPLTAGIAQKNIATRIKS